MTPDEAMQSWLRIEHEAVWLYPVIGARFDGLASKARSSYLAHRNRRDQLLARLHASGVDPAPTSLGYDEGPLRSTKQARAEAQRVERNIAAACLTLAGVTDGDARTYAVDNLRRAALAQIKWGAQPTAFPGLP
ncbi:ferritin-like domain-containing protein [Aeromicrobium sp.]|uniref:ferritin-like domain-containing protein n=1 Tax=Aeromicrobium sp. TaxID=1871063 RepID=UPI003C596D33